MSNEHIYLGKISRDRIYLYKHEWACGWYWGFGYLGNNQLHFHIDSLITTETDVNKIFSETELSQKDWWVIRDLFIQAYALKKAVEVYQHGGHNITLHGCTDILRYPTRNEALIGQLNDDLERILDKVWEYISNNIGK